MHKRVTSLLKMCAHRSQQQAEGSRSALRHRSEDVVAITTAENIYNFQASVPSIATPSPRCNPSCPAHTVSPPPPPALFSLHTALLLPYPRILLHPLPPTSSFLLPVQFSAPKTLHSTPRAPSALPLAAVSPRASYHLRSKILFDFIPVTAAHRSLLAFHSRHRRKKSKNVEAAHARRQQCVHVRVPTRRSEGSCDHSRTTTRRAPGNRRLPPPLRPHGRAARGSRGGTADAGTAALRTS